ncbi:uncharacterized protein LOC134527902 [Bacillus rossius redtenbacheri]|uniref:uncharacterized protein LOC134527902 n=1 Tax=Bacillus rossius redtenbacheri TaxID=93214 RepID=UPI002FDEC543
MEVNGRPAAALVDTGVSTVFVRPVFMPAGHIQQITMAEVSRTQKPLQRFIGLLNWLQNYIPNFSQVIAPMIDLLSPQISYHWGSPTQTPFEAIKSAFTWFYTLASIDPERPLILQTDASALGTEVFLTEADLERHDFTAQHRSPDSDRRSEAVRGGDHPSWQLREDRVMNRPPGEENESKTYVPTEARKATLRFYHDHDLAGHPDSDQIRRAVCRYYHWPGVNQDVRVYVRECEICQRRKARRATACTNSSLASRQCRSRQAYPCGNAQAATFIEDLTRKFLTRFGYPESVLTDNGSQFLGEW